jgi:hypothetical protein
MFSPALPTSIQQGFHPPFPMNGQSALQTPMQPYFLLNHQVHQVARHMLNTEVDRPA